MSLRSFHEVCRKLQDDEFSQAQPLQKVLGRKGSQHDTKSYQGKNGKERTKKEPADEEFFGTVEIWGVAKK